MEDKKDYKYKGYTPQLKENARNLRKNMTKQEKHLWYDYLRHYPIKFYRQRVIDRYIADFYCSEARLVIELDGSQHFTEKGIEYDRIRTDVLEKYQLKVVRFTNSDIDKNFAGVCKYIDTVIKERINEQTNFR